ncbi:MAG: WhiB family transcriptional regulator [Actinomycetota bacterium]
MSQNVTGDRDSATVLAQPDENLDAPRDWREWSICNQTDPEAFFPEHGGRTARPGKQICMSCGVRSECLQEALERDEKWGIWGGLTRQERRHLGRRAV